MKILDTQTIRDLLEETWTAEKRRLHSEKIRTSGIINGCQTARELSDIIDEAVIRILQEMELPEDITIVGEGWTWRQEATPWSDFDASCYLSHTTGFEEDFLSLKDFCNSFVKSFHFFSL